MILGAGLFVNPTRKKTTSGPGGLVRLEFRLCRFPPSRSLSAVANRCAGVQQTWPAVVRCRLSPGSRFADSRGRELLNLGMAQH